MRWTVALILAIGLIGGCSSPPAAFDYRKRPDGTEVAVLRNFDQAWPMYAKEFIGAAAGAAELKEPALKASAELGVRNQIQTFYDKLDQENARLRNWFVSEYAQYINGELEASEAMRQKSRDAWAKAKSELLASSERVRVATLRIEDLTKLGPRTGTPPKSAELQRANELSTDAVNFLNSLAPMVPEALQRIEEEQGKPLAEAATDGSLLRSMTTSHAREGMRMDSAGHVAFTLPIRDEKGSRATNNIDRSIQAIGKVRRMTVYFVNVSSSSRSAMSYQGKEDVSWGEDPNIGPVLRHGDTFDLAPGGSFYFAERGLTADRVLTSSEDGKPAIELVEVGYKEQP